MAIDTFMVYVGVYADADSATADNELVKDLHVTAGLIDAYDAAVVVRRENGKVKIVAKHETPTRVGGVLGGGIGEAGLIVVGVSDMGARIEREMRRAEKIQRRDLAADLDELESDAASASTSTDG